MYYGFAVLDDVVVDGFALGMITDWETEPRKTGMHSSSLQMEAERVWFGRSAISRSARMRDLLNKRLLVAAGRRHIWWERVWRTGARVAANRAPAFPRQRESGFYRLNLC